MTEEMPTYEIGTRLRGFSKDHFKNLAKSKENSEENDYLNKKYVPHITFLRPFYIKENSEESELISRFGDFCEKDGGLYRFQITNLNYFPNKQKVIYGKISPENEITEFSENLEKQIYDMIKYKHEKIKNPGDPSMTPHVAIFKNRENENFKQALRELQKSIDLPIDQFLIRTYLLKDKQILREYDFCLERSLKRDETMDPATFRKTIDSFTSKTGLKPSPNGFVRA